MICHNVGRGTAVRAFASGEKMWNEKEPPQRGVAYALPIISWN